MTPQEAADVLDDGSLRLRDDKPGRALCVLIDHARATAEPEIVTGAEAAELPDGSIIAGEDDLVVTGALSRPREPLRAGWHGGEDPGEFPGLRYRVLYRPPPPIAVGDTVTTAAELDRLPIGTVVRAPRHGRAVEKHGEEAEGDWYRAGDPDRIDRDLLLGARVLDLGEVTS